VEPPNGEAVNARPWRGRQPPARILAIRIQAMGDTVATLPYLSALRRQVPNVQLDFLTRSDYVDLPKSVDLATRVFALDGRRPRAQVLSAIRLLPQLWARRYHVVIDLQRNRASRLVRRFLLPRAWSEFDRFSPILGGERFRLTIEAAGMGPLDVYPDLRLREPEAGREKLLAAGWNPAADLVILNPGGAVRDRHWPVERYAVFARLLGEGLPRPVQFAVLGIQKVADHAAALRHELGDQLVNLVNATSLREAVSIVRRARLMVSEDAGLMHVAWVLGVPTVGLFGASRWVWARPHGNYSVLVVACRRPDGVCMHGTCGVGAPSCLQRLPVERVLQAAQAALRAPDGGKVIARGGQPIFGHQANG